MDSQSVFSQSVIFKKINCSSFALWWNSKSTTDPLHLKSAGEKSTRNDKGIFFSAHFTTACLGTRTSGCYRAELLKHFTCSIMNGFLRGLRTWTWKPLKQIFSAHFRTTALFSRLLALQATKTPPPQTSPLQTTTAALGVSVLVWSHRSSGGKLSTAQWCYGLGNYACCVQ